MARAAVDLAQEEEQQFFDLRRRFRRCIRFQPPLHLLEEPAHDVEPPSAETLEFTSRLIERKLADFGVQVKVLDLDTGAPIGPNEQGMLWATGPNVMKGYLGRPDATAEVGHCVHRIALHPSRPDVLFMQKHWDVMRSDNAGELWQEVSGDLPSDFGFAIDVHAHEPETIYVIPIKSDSEHYPPEGKLRVYRSRKGGNDWEALTDGLPQRDCYVNVLRDAMAVDSLDPCGIYFGTTGGQVYASPDGGDHWTPIVRDLPAVLSVEVQTLP